MILLGLSSYWMCSFRTPLHDSALACSLFSAQVCPSCRPLTGVLWIQAVTYKFAYSASVSVSFSSQSSIIKERNKNAAMLERERMRVITCVIWDDTCIRIDCIQEEKRATRQRGRERENDEERDRERLMLMLSANLQLAAVVSRPLISL